MDRQRFFDIEPYMSPVESWSREMKSQLTQEYHRTLLANATEEIADQKDYVTMAKLIRPFAKSFAAKEGYNLHDLDSWTPAQKGKLTKYFKKGVALASKQFELYHSNDPESMRAMSKLANQESFPEFNQVFFPAPPGAKLHYDKRTGSATATGLREVVTGFYWDQFGVTPEMLAVDPVGVTLDRDWETDLVKFGKTFLIR